MLNNSVFKRFKQGFTLIELLIVVAIIAILAAIAVPNFLEAQTRAKVSRVMSDLRTYDTAMSTYRIDHNKPSPTYRHNRAETRKWIVRYLTTPIAYMTQALPDPFNTNLSHPENRGMDGNPDPDQRYLIAWGPDHLHSPDGVYSAARETQYAGFFQLYPVYSNGSKFSRRDFVFFFSMGPDHEFDILDGKTPRAVHTYDATNGTVSRGEIGRFSG
jgi:prepilin-type N-terminal cleavage/methylation domain-containing protein